MAVSPLEAALQRMHLFLRADWLTACVSKIRQLRPNFDSLSPDNQVRDFIGPSADASIHRP